MNASKELSRRDFLELSVHGAVGVGVSAIPLLTTAGCSDQTTKTVHGACCLDCPDTCSWQVTVVNNSVKEFKASSDHPFTAGKLCDKMMNYPTDVTYSSHRLLKPLKRVGQKGKGEFVEISWAQALSEVSTQLKTILREKGGEAILPFSYGGNEGMVQGRAGTRFFAHIGASQLDRTICGAAVEAGLIATNGQTTGVLPEDIVHSRYIILWGTNTVHSNQHLWPFIEKAQTKGAKIVVVDPFQSQTALQADWHIQPMPGTDTALALGLINVILAENLQDRDYIDKYTTGIEELTAHVQKYTPEAVARLTGLAKETIVELARAYAKGSPSLIRILIGLEHHANGANACRAIAILPALTGAWKQLGGGLMNMTYELFGNALNGQKVEWPDSLKKSTARTVNMVQLGKALTDAEAPPIHALIVFNANPAVTLPNQNLVVKGLKREDMLVVVLEHFMTDTARHADYVFPATTSLENWDLLTSYGTPYLTLNEPAIEPLGQSKTNTEFFRLLAKEMGFNESYLYESDLDIVKSAFDSDHEYLKGITFESLRKTGWAKMNIPNQWMPHAQGNFGKPGGKCTFYDASLTPPVAEYRPLHYSAEELASYPLHLLTIKSAKNFLNSSRANHAPHRRKEGMPFLNMNEEDAGPRNIKEGDELKVFNRLGEVYLTARIMKKVRKGVVCMPQGFWPSLMKGGASANALTNELLTDMGGSAALQETKVQVVKLSGRKVKA